MAADRPMVAQRPRDGTSAAPGLAGLAPLAGSVVLLGGAWPVTRYALLLGASPAWFAAGRALLSAVAALCVLGVLGRLRRPGRADLPALLAVGLLQLAGFFALSHEAAGYIAAGRTAILANTTTIWVVPLSLLVLGERIPPRRWWAAGIGLAWVVALTGPWAIDWSSRTALIGHGLLLAAALSFALAIVIVRRAPPRMKMLELLPWCFVLAAAVLVPLAVLGAPSGGIGSDPRAWAALLSIGLLAGPVGTWCVLQSVSVLPALVASIGVLATPAAGLILATLWLGERLDGALIAGAGLILASVALAAWPGPLPAGGRRDRAG